MVDLPPPPPPPGAVGASDAAVDRDRRIRWGMGDAAWTMAAGFLVASVAGAVELAVRYPGRSAATVTTDSLDTAVAAAAQFATIAVALVLLVGRRGFGLRHDLGFVVRVRDWPYLFAGVGCAIGMSVVSAPIARLWQHRGHDTQAIGQAVSRSTGWATALLVVLVVVVAPLLEEAVFRGVVLRGAMRRIPAVGAVLVSGATFGAIHLIDPTTFPSFPALMGLGVVSAIIAVRSGELSRSVLLHMGFNLVGAISLLHGTISLHLLGS